MSQGADDAIGRRVTWREGGRKRFGEVVGARGGRVQVAEPELRGARVWVPVSMLEQRSESDRSRG